MFLLLSPTWRKLSLFLKSELKQQAKETWLLVGDFNLICNATDKNNGRIKMQMITRFNRALDDLQELPQQGRKFQQ
jgi:hypothetical protein